MSMKPLLLPIRLIMLPLRPAELPLMVVKLAPWPKMFNLLLTVSSEPPKMMVPLMPKKMLSVPSRALAVLIASQRLITPSLPYETR